MLQDLENHLTSVGCSYKIIQVEPKDECTYRLSDRSPANVGSNGNIFIMQRLNEPEKNEAIAHELGHIYFEHQGQVSLQNFVDRHGLPLEINNVISHRAIIAMLKNDYDIESNLHKTLRLEVLNEAESFLSELNKSYSKGQVGCIDCKYYLAAYALRLRDIETCFPEFQGEVENILTLQSYLDKVVSNARIILFDAAAGLPKSRQEEKINQFIRSIGLGSDEFEYR